MKFLFEQIPNFKRKIVGVFFSEEGIIPFFLSIIFGTVVGITIFPLGLKEGWFWLMIKIVLPLLFCELLINFYLPNKEDKREISILVMDCYVIGAAIGVFLFLTSTVL